MLSMADAFKVDHKHKHDRLWLSFINGLVVQIGADPIHGRHRVLGAMFGQRP